MSTQKQQSLKEKYYNEAQRYISNAKETLQMAGKEDRFYKDEKYVKTACGTAYNGVLKALDGYLILKNVPKKKGRKSIEYYTEAVARIDKKLLAELNNTYQILHLFGYYDGTTSIPVVTEGFDLANRIIERIHP